MGYDLLCARFGECSRPAATGDQTALSWRPVDCCQKKVSVFGVPKNKGYIIMRFILLLFPYLRELQGRVGSDHDLEFQSLRHPVELCNLHAAYPVCTLNGPWNPPRRAQGLDCCLELCRVASKLSMFSIFFAVRKGAVCDEHGRALKAFQLSMQTHATYSKGPLLKAPKDAIMCAMHSYKSICCWANSTQLAFCHRARYF